MAETTNLLAEFISRLNLSEEIAQTFAKGGRLATIRRGESVVKQGELCRYVIAILEGTFEAIGCRPDGQQRLLGFGFANEFVTDYPAFLAQSAARYTIQAITEVADECFLLFLQSQECVPDFFRQGVTVHVHHACVVHGNGRTYLVQCLVK